VRRQELIPYWETEPLGDRNAQVTEAPARRGFGFPSFSVVCPVLPEDDQILHFPRPFSRASECCDQGEGGSIRIAGNGTLISAAVNFF
jgi:hypothetical protein